MQTSYDKEEAIMADVVLSSSPDYHSYPESYHSHRTLDNRVDDLEEEVGSLREAVSILQGDKK